MRSGLWPAEPKFKTVQQRAIARVRSLARLIAVASDAKTGEAKIRQGKVEIELLNKSGRVMHILEVKLDKKLKFEGLRMIEPDGDRLRTFV